MWMSEPGKGFGEQDRFEGMNRVGFFVHVRTSYEFFGEPKYKEIVERAEAIDEASTLSTSTVSDVLRRKSCTRLDTARWLGMGIAGPELGASFVDAWQTARENHSRETHDEAMRAAQEAQAGGHTPPFEWWRLLSRDRKVTLFQILLGVATRRPLTRSDLASAVLTGAGRQRDLASLVDLGAGFGQGILAPSDGGVRSRWRLIRLALSGSPHSSRSAGHCLGQMRGWTLCSSC